MSYIRRTSGKDSVTIANGTTTSGAIDLGDVAGGSFILGSGWVGGAKMGWTASDSQTGTYVTVYDETNTAVSITVAASRAYPLPAEVLQHRWVKFVSSGAGTGDQTIPVIVKS